MKKTLVLFWTIAMVFLFCACGKDSSASTSIEDTNPTTIGLETETQTDPANHEESTSGTLNAKEFDEIIWPTTGAATKVPAPTWSSHGTFLGTTESDTYLWVQIGYTSFEDYAKYVKECQDYGYTENSYTDFDCLSPIYYGEDGFSYAIQLTYNKYDCYVAIQVTGDAGSWNKWWVD